MTHFSFEVPLVHLQDFDDLQDFTFALSFLFDNKDYTRYVDRKCTSGQVVYIDNSFNETQVPATPEHMVQLYNEFLPTTVASPDSDQWSVWQVRHAFWECAKWIPVNRILGIFKNRQELDDLTSMGAKHLAVSYWWRRHPSLDNCIRVRFHYLGLGNLGEVVEDRPHSLDTSIPIKLALRGIKFEDWDGIYHQATGSQLRGDYRLKRAWDYFHIQMTPAEVDLARHNIQVLKEIVNGRIKYGSGRTTVTYTRA